MLSEVSKSHEIATSIVLGPQAVLRRFAKCLQIPRFVVYSLPLPLDPKCRLRAAR